jgi:hypothetical protein
MTDTRDGGVKLAWKGGKCRVPMWCMGVPSGFCDDEAFGPQLPANVLMWGPNRRLPYCHGPCCPGHGYTAEGRPMYCAVMPDFEDLQESPAGFSGNPNKAIANLRAALSRTKENGNG